MQSECSLVNSQDYNYIVRSIHRFCDLFCNAVGMFFGKFSRLQLYCQVDIKCSIFMSYLSRVYLLCGYNRSNQTVYMI